MRGGGRGRRDGRLCDAGAGVVGVSGGASALPSPPRLRLSGESERGADARRWSDAGLGGLVGGRGGQRGSAGAASGCRYSLREKRQASAGPHRAGPLLVVFTLGLSCI